MTGLRGLTVSVLLIASAAAGAAVLMIYVILAWLFGSYFQPLAVMLGVTVLLLQVLDGRFEIGMVERLSGLPVVPVDADLVFDARFLPNPYWILELRDGTGQDARDGRTEERAPPPAAPLLRVADSRRRVHC